MANEDEKREHAEYLEFRKTRHDQRLLENIDGKVLPGVRLVDAKDPSVGLVVNFYANEAEPVIAAIKAVLAARVAE